ncbi:hypothetical protein DPMN_126357 [Dreissena polymorpha]|uniref:DDE-1 domain-containing protein n=1 Tax=Dreissena polymorpha TaxID=45954 RepID=A0A9D4GZD3_DREPO|nr:hypothetical protein DPMN_126357 [Dreissena polymorpha]
MIIFAKNLPRDLQPVPESWSAVKSPKGYMDSSLFVKWLNESFIPNCGRSRPDLLIMDNLKAHLTPEATDVARTNQVELFCLSPHSTHLLKLLDVRILHLLKGNLAKVSQRLCFQSLQRSATPAHQVCLEHAVTV